ncbi:MAG TPA: hypothetical protein DHW49_04435 [Anaerolineae bacterium]|nr:hypothetical protein [Anaerolineae bacterium]
MRVALEELTVFEYITIFSKFDEASAEIIAKVPKQKNFGDEFRYEKVIRKLKKDGREKVYGMLSNLGTHLSPVRVALSRRGDGERERLKVGMMLGNPNTPIALGELARIYLFSIDVFNNFFIKFLQDPTKSPFNATLPIARSKYESLAKKENS